MIFFYYGGVNWNGTSVQFNLDSELASASKGNAIFIRVKKMEELWSSRLSSWFPQGLEDPKICLVKVVTEDAHFWNHTSSKMGLLFQMIRSITKGDQYKENEKGQLNLAPTPPEM